MSDCIPPAPPGLGLRQSSGAFPLSIGRIVLYVFTNHHGNRVIRPAVIVAVPPSDPAGYVNLHVFVDESTDLKRGRTIHSTFTSVRYDESASRIHSWHWPPRV